MLIGIVSALLFDSGKVPHAVAGTIGIAAGVAAIAMYFWNQSRSKADEESATKVEAELDRKAEVAREVKSMPTYDLAWVIANRLSSGQIKPFYTSKHFESFLEAAVLNADARTAEAYRRKRACLYLTDYAQHHARTLRWQMPKDSSLALMQPEVELSPNELAACALEIMHNLALSEDVKVWDYTLGPKGLRVSVRKSQTSRSVVPQEYFDFDPMSSMAV